MNNCWSNRLDADTPPAVGVGFIEAGNMAGLCEGMAVGAKGGEGPDRTVEPLELCFGSHEYRSGFARRIVSLMGEGYSATAAAGQLGLCRQTLRDWATDHDEFSNALRVGQARRTAFLEEMLLSGRNNTGAMFALKSACPEEWPEQRGKDPSGASPQPERVRVSDTELAQALALILARAGSVCDQPSGTSEAEGED